jgi:hypothetical protein
MPTIVAQANRSIMSKQKGKMKRLILGGLCLLLSVNAEDFHDDFNEMTWTSWHSAKAQVRFEHSADKGIAGSGALRLILLGNDSGKQSGTFLKNFPVKPSTWYRVEVFMKQDGTQPVEAEACLDVDGRSKENRFQKKLTNGVAVSAGMEWRKLVCFFHTPAQTENIQVQFHATSSKETAVLFDDFSLTEINLEDGVLEGFDCTLWDCWKTKGMKMQTYHSENEGRTAKGAMCLEITAPPENWKDSGSLLTRLPVVPGREYTFLAYVKSEGLPEDATISMGLQAQDEKCKFLGLQTLRSQTTADASAGQWKRLLITYRIPSTGKWLECRNMLLTLGCKSSAPGKIYFDDFEFFITSETGDDTE